MDKIRLDRALEKAPPNRGLGWDKFNPRAIRRLPLSYRRALVDILNKWEEDPEMLLALCSFFAFIPKSGGGGVRPIGLTVFLLRTWTRIRAEDAKAWEERLAHKHPFFVGGAGKDCVTIGWVHNMRAAYARIKDLQAASGIHDLQKFYENISHDVLRQEALAEGFPLRLLRGLCTYYGGYRVAVLGGAASEPFCVGGTVVPGCSCAQSVAKLMLQRALRDLAQRCPAVLVKNIVDDVSLQAVGTHKVVVKELSRATTLLKAAASKLELPLEVNKKRGDCRNARLGERLGAQTGLPQARLKTHNPEPRHQCAQRRKETHSDRKCKGKACAEKVCQA